MAPESLSKYCMYWLGEPFCQFINLRLIQKSVAVDEAGDDDDDDDDDDDYEADDNDDDDDDAVQAMEGALVVGLVVCKCQCSMHEQQHS